jgi:hypothetical protein
MLFRRKVFARGGAAAALAMSATMALVGCDEDPRPACAATYQHLLELAQRNDDPALMTRFVSACEASFDPVRLECIRAARTPGAALACKPVRKRPG